MNILSLQRHASTMNVHSKCRKRQFVPIVLLLLMSSMMLTGAGARPSLHSLLSPQSDVSDVFLDELLTKVNGDNLYHELKKYQHKQPNYLSKWPGLRDLVLTIDYDDELTGGQAENNEVLNYKLLERLRQLAPSTEGRDWYQDVREETPEESMNIPLKPSKAAVNHVAFKEHNAKKNVQYMSPCHFKICNMGRKRDARTFQDNY